MTKSHSIQLSQTSMILPTATSSCIHLFDRQYIFDWRVSCLHQEVPATTRIAQHTPMHVVKHSVLEGTVGAYRFTILVSVRATLYKFCTRNLRPEVCVLTYSPGLPYYSCGWEPACFHQTISVAAAFGKSLSHSRPARMDCKTPSCLLVSYDTLLGFRWVGSCRTLSVHSGGSGGSGGLSR